MNQRSLTLSVGVICALAVTAAQVPLPTTTTTQGAGDGERRVRELEAEAERLAGASRTLLGELRALEVERALKAAAARTANEELAALNIALQKASARVSALAAERVEGSEQVRTRLVEIYKRGRPGYIRVLLAADDVRALGRMTRAVATIGTLDRVRFEAHRRTLQAEEQAVRDLQQRRGDLVTAQAEAARARRALDAAVAAHSQRLAQLDRERDVAAQYVGEMQAAAQALQQRVSRMGSSATTGEPARGRLAERRGALEWPASGRLLSRFGIDRSGGPAVTRNGVDIGANEGSDVRAVHGGEVAFAAPFLGFGSLVILDHGDNAFTLYGHLQQTLVTQGTRLEQGAVLGRAGRNPAGIPALYFEVRIDGRAVDPVQWLRNAL